MSIEKVKAFMQERGYAHRIQEFSVSSAIELTLSELEALTKPSVWVDVCKLPE